MTKKARMINVEVTSRVSIEISGTEIYFDVTFRVAS